MRAITISEDETVNAYVSARRVAPSSILVN